MSVAAEASRHARAVAAAALGALLAAPAAAQRGDAPDTPLRPPEEQRRLFRTPPGFEVQLVAAEPDIQKPMNLAFDAAGRLWVTGSTLYPWPARRDAHGELIADFQKHWDDNSLAFRATSTPPEPAEHGVDSLRILSDFDPATGRARKVSVFADNLNIPIGVLPLPREAGAKGDRALVFSIPAIWRLSDTDRDGRADRREKLYDGFGFRDTHGMSSSYWLWFDGWVYGTHGYSNPSEITDRQGNVTKLQSGNTYRFRPDGSRFEVFAHGQTNPFGLAFDARGDVYTADSHSRPVTLLVPGGYYDGISREHDGLGFAPFITTDDHGSSAIAGLAVYAATQFPREFHGDVFNGNPVTRRVNRARLDWRGSSPTAVRLPDLLTSDDRAFRPVQAKLGPDGALWIADFYNPIIGHYEVPLTHPGRDRTHGRIWRVVWRGLDGSVPSPAVPDLAHESTAALAARLADPNLVVRSLAASELLARPDAVSAVPALRERLDRLIAGTDAQADDAVALGLLFAFERLGAADNALLRRALSRPDSGVAIAALRVLEARAELPGDAEALFTGIVARPKPSSRPKTSRAAGAEPPLEQNAPVSPLLAAPGYSWRLVAQILARHEVPWAAPLLLGMLERAPAADFELVYALRVALKKQALTAGAATLRAWAGEDHEHAERVSDICLAVPTPAAAAFLLEHLERTKSAGRRAGEFARHAVQHLPPHELDAVLPLLRSLARSPRAQRLPLALGLAAVAAKPGRSLPAEADTWMRDELAAGIAEKDATLALRAINAARPLAIPEKAAPLRAVALDAKARENVRLAALRALDPKAPATEETLIAVLSQPGSNYFRRTAAELLGNTGASATARAALVDALSTASADLALGIATALAKSDAGAEQLLGLARTGRLRATLLRHRYVAAALEKRPASIREAAAELTRALPPEDARLDALVAQRVAAASNHDADLARGAALFATHCASCHRFRDTGGNLGPSLDGIGSRSLPRLVEDILDPNRNVDPAFRLTTVTLRNGETKSGLNHREQGDRILLADPATGQDITLARAEISDTAPSTLSPMPPAFDTLLTEPEFLDLLEYLRAPAR